MTRSRDEKSWERDFDLLSREQFLSDHVRRWERY